MLCSKELLYVLIVYYRITLINSCHTFENNIITTTDAKGNKFDENITGCLQRISFDGKTVTEVLIKNQSIPIIYEDTVRHMSQLQKLSFWKCRINEIKPRAFRNMPRLEHIYVTYSNVTLISNDVFSLVPSLMQIRLHNNNITDIEDLAFNNLTNLKRFNISHNYLTDWKKEWFSDTSMLEIIDFSFNKISNLPNGAFENLPELKEIHFDYNDISSLGKDIFNGIVFLQYVGFGNNKIAVIHSRVFSNPIRIDFLHLEANYLTFVPQEVLNKLDVDEITVYGNPFNCNCYERFVNWLRRNHVKKVCKEICDRPDLPICVVPNRELDGNCTIVSDTEDIETFFRAYKNSDPPVDPSCARLN